MQTTSRIFLGSCYHEDKKVVVYMLAMQVAIGCRILMLNTRLVARFESTALLGNWQRGQAIGGQFA